MAARHIISFRQKTALIGNGGRARQNRFIEQQFNYLLAGQTFRHCDCVHDNIADAQNTRNIAHAGAWRQIKLSGLHGAGKSAIDRKNQRASQNPGCGKLAGYIFQRLTARDHDLPRAVMGPGTKSKTQLAAPINRLNSTPAPTMKCTGRSRRSFKNFKTRDTPRLLECFENQRGVGAAEPKAV